MNMIVQKDYANLNYIIEHRINPPNQRNQADSKYLSILFNLNQHAGQLGRF